MEYIHCIKNPSNDKITICGKDSSMKWLFQDITHAFLSREQKQYHLVCKKCSKIVFDTLNNQD
jgi:hypothetical protein